MNANFVFDTLLTLIPEFSQCLAEICRDKRQGDSTCSSKLWFSDRGLNLMAGPMRKCVPKPLSTHLIYSHRSRLSML